MSRASHRAKAAGCQGTIVQRHDRIHCHLSRPLDGPIVILLEQERADHAGAAPALGKRPTTSGRCSVVLWIDVAIDAYDRVFAVQLEAMLPGEPRTSSILDCLSIVAVLGV